MVRSKNNREAQLLDNIVPKLEEIGRGGQKSYSPLKLSCSLKPEKSSYSKSGTLQTDVHQVVLDRWHVRVMRMRDLSVIERDEG